MTNEYEILERTLSYLDINDLISASYVTKYVFISLAINNILIKLIEKHLCFISVPGNKFANAYCKKEKIYGGIFDVNPALFRATIIRIKSISNRCWP